MRNNILHLVPPPASPRPIQDSHAILHRLLAAAFAVIAEQLNDDWLAEDLVEEISLTVLAWSERHGLDHHTTNQPEG